MPGDEIDAILSVEKGGGAGSREHAGAGEQRGGSRFGHFGNFELYARANRAAPEFQFATTYRALRQAGVPPGSCSSSGAVRGPVLRTAHGCHGAARGHEPDRIMIGFLADQDAGDRGLAVPFFGRDCSTSAAPAVFALRYQCPLHVAICYRTALARWHIEVSEAIPTHDATGQPREVAAIALDMNRAYEAAIRRDPANWFWVHRRWKRPGRKPATHDAAAAAPAEE